MITTNILQRTFRIAYGNDSGTCFTVDVDGRQYLVTARHVVRQISGPSTVKIFHDGLWKELPIQLVGHGADDIDITVLSPPLQLSPTHPLHTTAAGLPISQEVFFLGFPYGLATDPGKLNDNFPIPFVKKGMVSALSFENSKIIYLDGHNNRGFSGGPIVYQRAVDKEGDMTVIGVVSGYLSKAEPVYDSHNQATHSYGYNTGIIKSYSIAHATELIRANPIGFDLNSH